MRADAPRRRGGEDGRGEGAGAHDRDGDVGGADAPRDTRSPPRGSAMTAVAMAAVAVRGLAVAALAMTTVAMAALAMAAVTMAALAVTALAMAARGAC